MKKSVFPIIAVIALAGLSVLAQQNNGGGRGQGRGAGGGGRGAAGGPGGPGGGAGGPGGGAGGGMRQMMGAGGGAGAMAGGMMGGNWLEGRIMQADFMEKAGITQENVDKLKAALKELDDAAQKINEEIRTLSLQQAELMRKVLTDADAKPDDLMALTEKIGGLRTEQAKLLNKRLLVIRDNLTPEQRKKVGDLLQEEQQQRQQRMQQRQQGGGAGAPGGGARNNANPPAPAAPQGW